MAAAESADALVAAAGLLCAVGRAMVELDATLTPTPTLTLTLTLTLSLSLTLTPTVTLTRCPS